MGLTERPKKKTQLWKKASVHFLLCFIMGFFTGFAPTNKSYFPTQNVVASNVSPEISPPREEISDKRVDHENGNFDRSMLDESLAMKVQERPNVGTIDDKGDMANMTHRRLVIIVTPTNDKDELRGVLLTKMANTLSLVPAPLLWVVVESQSESTEVSDILRKTNVMYRHLVFKENFTDVEVEMDHQRNVALKHIEYHRLSGIVHFASLYNVYDLSFFEEIRTIEVFGTWPMAFLSVNRQRVRIEGPVCDSSEVIGWHLKSLNNSADDATRSPVQISTVGFNSSILWDPERWGRLSTDQHTSQNSIKFVKEEVLEEDTKLKGIPQDGCSKIMLWNLHIPKVLRSLGNLIAGDAYSTNVVLVPGYEITDNIIHALSKCLNSEHRVLKKEAAWVLSNIAAGSIAHKQLIYKSEAVPLLIQLLSTSTFDIKKEVAYVVGNLCVAPAEGSGRSSLIFDHLVAFVRSGCLRGFIDLVRSADIEAARLGLQFMELVLRGMPNGEGQKLVEKEDGIDAMERFQFHENEDLRNMANQLVDKYFGEDYGLDE